MERFENGLPLFNQIEERRTEEDLQTVTSIREESASSSDANMDISVRQEFISAPAMQSDRPDIWLPKIDSGAKRGDRCP